jgi:transposase
LSEEKNNVEATVRELGIGSPMKSFRVGKKKIEQYLHNSFPGHGKPKRTNQEREIDRLEKALQDVQL